MTSPPDLVGVDAHLRQILDTCTPLGTLDLQLGDAHGCLLAEDVTAPQAIPPFDNSSMDGYAVRADDLRSAGPGAPVTLHVAGDIAAGDDSVLRVTEGFCVRIMTGAPMPAGADAVVPVEWTDGGERTVRVDRGPSVGEYVRRTGSDLGAGASVLAAGAFLGAAQIGLLAAIGRPRIRVQPRPRVVVLSTGSELVAPGRPLAPGQIYDANSFALAAACIEAGAQPFRMAIVPDDREQLREALEDHLIRADAVITSGGVSVGAYDVVKAELKALGTMVFRRVAMQPGMPQGFGTIGAQRVPLFALPGNPVSALVSFEVFVRPALRRLLGSEQLFRPQVQARLTAPWSSPAGKRQFVRVIARYDPYRGYSAEPVGGAGSHLMAAMAAANALLVVPEDVTTLAAGDSCAAMLLDRRAA